MCAHQTAQWPTIRVIEGVHGGTALIIYLRLAAQIFVMNICAVAFLIGIETADSGSRHRDLRSLNLVP